jgi:hypothetical protein
MEGSAAPNRFVRFGAFELDVRTGELRQSGRRLPLQHQPLRLLSVLLERIEGVNYLIDARRGVSATLLAGGAFETRRAIAAGRRVGAEVRDARAVTLAASRP